MYDRPSGWPETGDTIVDGCQAFRGLFGGVYDRKPVLPTDNWDIDTGPKTRRKKVPSYGHSGVSMKVFGKEFAVRVVAFDSTFQGVSLSPPTLRSFQSYSRWEVENDRASAKLHVLSRSQYLKMVNYMYFKLHVPLKLHVFMCFMLHVVWWTKRFPCSLFKISSSKYMDFNFTQWAPIE